TPTGGIPVRAEVRREVDAAAGERDVEAAEVARIALQIECIARGQAVDGRIARQARKRLAAVGTDEDAARRAAGGIPGGARDDVAAGHQARDRETAELPRAELLPGVSAVRRPDDPGQLAAEAREVGRLAVVAARPDACEQHRIAPVNRRRYDGRVSLKRDDRHRRAE